MRQSKTIKSVMVPLQLAALLLFSLSAVGAEHSQLKAFPAAEEGMKRLVIELPEKKRGEKDDFKVELIPGKMMATDGVNLIRTGLSLEPRPLKGWGYTYYEVTGSDQSMSTLMAVPEGSEKVNKFVPGTSLFIRYNSRLPIVIYSSPEYEIQYRIWTAGAIQKVSVK